MRAQTHKSLALLLTIAVLAPKSYEFGVRLSSGARRVIIDANPASWRLGERG